MSRSSSQRCRRGAPPVQIVGHDFSIEQCLGLEQAKVVDGGGYGPGSRGPAGCGAEHGIGGGVEHDTGGGMDGNPLGADKRSLGGSASGTAEASKVTSEALQADVLQSLVFHATNEKDLTP